MKKKHLTGIVIAAVVFGIITVAIVVGVTLRSVNAEYESSQTLSHSDLIISESEPAEFSNDNGDNIGPAAEVVNGEIIYKNSDSGSCPPIIDVADYDENSEIYTLSITYYGEQKCTMDLRPFQQTIKHADGSKVPENAVIEIV